MPVLDVPRLVLLLRLIFAFVSVQKRLNCCCVVDVLAVHSLSAVPPAHNVQPHAYVLQPFFLDSLLNLVAVPILYLLLLLCRGLAVVAALFLRVLTCCWSDAASRPLAASAATSLAACALAAPPLPDGHRPTPLRLGLPHVLAPIYYLPTRCPVNLLLKRANELQIIHY